VVTDLAEVCGQEAAKRALEVAAAGGHGLMLIGPAGAGKTLLARCLPGLLPPGDDPAAPRPVRVPGLGLTPKGVAREFALAAGGTLILDDLPALRPATLRALAEALDGDHAQLVATMRPCPCGHLGDYRADCACTPGQVRRWRARVSTRLTHRFDLVVGVPAVTLGELQGGAGEPSARVAGRVAAARAVQAHRGGLNAAMGPGEVETRCPLDTAGRALLDAAFERLGLSAAGAPPGAARGAHRRRSHRRRAPRCRPRRRGDPVPAREGAVVTALGSLQTPWPIVGLPPAGPRRLAAHPEPLGAGP
jgi:magnesium chelatase family protein